jgi:hypothetical protein
MAAPYIKELHREMIQLRGEELRKLANMSVAFAMQRDYFRPFSSLNCS